MPVLGIPFGHPVHVVDPDTGFSWYFYLDGVQIKMRRSGDYGATFIGSEVTVTTACDITPQTITAALCLDGSLMVCYLDGATFKTRRSLDLGLSWSGFD